MADTVRPSTPEETAEFVAWAAAEEEPLLLQGGASKLGYGRPVQASRTLDLSGLSGITLYEPAELVLSARAGTPMAEVEAALAQEGQQLAFEPADLGSLYGSRAGSGTIGGVLACNLAGPRRIKVGAARDHFLGFTAVNGRGEVFKAGGRVVKNVTGYDLPKLMAGSLGTLAALTDVTVKVLPVPERSATVLLLGLDAAAGVRALTRALQGPHDASAAAHLPAAVVGALPIDRARDGRAVTAIRLEGPGPSVEVRCAAVRRELADLRAPVETLSAEQSLALWRAIRDLVPLAAVAGTAKEAIWRVSVAPAAGAMVAEEIAAGLGCGSGLRHYFDWGGGLLWIAAPMSEDAGARVIRGAVARSGGHATLMRAPDAVRTAVPVFQPQPEPLAALSRRVKESFDPRRILNPGRMTSTL